MPRIADIRARMDEWFSPATAESWDSPGLSCGDPDWPVTGVLLAVDCLPPTIAEAEARGANLLLTHHPVLFRPVHSVAADTPKGAMLHRMIRAGIAHFAAHTNADIASGGVSEALAALLELRDVRPLVPAGGPDLDQLAVFVPPEHARALVAALTAAGAGALGDYDSCTFTVSGTGTFRPLAGANPFLGTVGQLAEVPEVRVDLVLPRSARDAVLAAMRAAHPYEQVAFQLTEQPALASATGGGRIGELTEVMSLAGLVEYIADRLPRTAGGVKASGDGDQPVRRLAVCGGAGGSYTDQARAAGADAFLTSDQRHHNSLEAVAELTGVAGARPMALIDAAHYATEHPWLGVLSARLSAEFPGLPITVSDLVTDPWNLATH